MTKQPDISIEEITEGLKRQVEEFCRDYLPNGVKEGSRWKCGDIYGSRGGSLSVPLSGEKQGRWRDFSSGEGGDLLNLIKLQRYPGAEGYAEAIKEAKQWLGYSESTGRVKQSRADDGRRSVRHKHPKREAQKDEADKRRWSLEMWNRSTRAEGTIVEAYLRGRGITIPPPPALRYHPRCEHKPSGAYHPMMVAAICAVELDTFTNKLTNRTRCVHRTWLVPEFPEVDPADVTIGMIDRAGPDVPTKRLKHSSAKMVMPGGFQGMFIPLTQATGRKVLAMTEGIENALSVAQVKPDWAVRSTISVGNMRGQLVPPWFERVVLVGDGDSKPKRDEKGQIVTHPDGSPLIPADELIKRAAQEIKDMAADDGRQLEVELMFPPPGKDVNDMLQEGTLT